MREKKIIVISLYALAVGCTLVPDNNMQTDNPGTIDTKTSSNLCVR